MRIQITRLLALALVALIGACADLPKTSAVVTLPASQEAQQRYEEGLEHYRNRNFELASGDLEAAIAGGKLKPARVVDAHKHLAFIHCLNNREVPCREQFQLILKIDPSFDLSPNEASHPSWRPIWLSLKSELGDRQAARNADSLSASQAERELGEGINAYAAGRYQEAINALHAALKSGLPGRVDEMRAHKLIAFSYCLIRRSTQCRAEFRVIFALDPAFVLLSSEVGHPAWSRIYKKELAAAKRASKAR
jgi:Tfp pilus assembly protein PilF